MTTLNGARALVPLFRDTWTDFQRKNVQWLAAALAYFAAFAVAPLIIVLVSIAGIFLGSNQAAMTQIFSYLKRDAGSGAGALRSIVQSTMNQHHAAGLAQIIGWIVVVVGAIGLFNALQFALNAIWEVQPSRSGIKGFLAQRGLAFLVIVGMALLLLVSIALNTGLTVMAGALASKSSAFPLLLKIGDFVISFAVLWLAFSFLYKYLPERRIEWSDVWTGGAFTSALFVIGQFLLGWYLGRAAIGSGYGAFGSLVVFLIWVNYTAQIVLFGATLTHVYARTYGSQRASSARGEVSSGQSTVGTT